MIWPVVKLIDVAFIQMGQSPPGHTYNSDHLGMPFFQGKTDFGEKHPKIRMYCSEPNRVAELGDILLSVRAPVGPTNVADRQCCIGRGLASIRPRDINLALSTYLQYVFKWVEPSLSRSGHGSTFTAIKRRDVENITFPLPSIEEQHRIVEFLSQADAIRKQRVEADTKTSRILPALFYNMFGDPISNGGKWPRKSFKEVCSKISDGTHHSPKPQSQGVKYITAKHIRPYSVNFKSAPTYVQLSDHKKIYSRCDPVKGDILYIKDGATTGAAALNPFEEEFSMLSSLALLKPDYDQVTPEYFVTYLNIPAVKQQMIGNMDGAAIRRLTLTKIKSATLPLPPLPLQQEFSKHYKDLQVQVEENSQMRDQLNTLYKVLMHRAFEGSLTASWRETHMKELLQEMDQQAKMLRGN